MTVAKYVLRDWLAIHGWSADDVRHILAMPACRVDGSDGAGAEPTGLSSEAAWAMSAQALTKAYPAAASEVARTAAETRRNHPLTAPGRPAFTMPDPTHGRPVVVSPWSGRVRDLLVMAHEFGHALQIVASAGRPVDPVSREVCAVLAEAALVADLAASGDPRAASVAHCMTERSSAGRDRLLAALNDPDAPYSYAWNHTAARQLWRQTSKLQPALLWQMYQGQMRAADLWQRVSCPD